jgi:dihydroorotate dehydrogenase
MTDLSVQIGSLTLKNPLIAASGCFGYGVEYADLVDLSSLGGVAVKGLFLTEREGHPALRIVETPAGMLNAIGLQGIGVRRFVDEKLPELRAVFDKVRRTIKGTAKKSRTEAFLDWAEENPEEILAVQQVDADRELKQLLKQQREQGRTVRDARRYKLPPEELAKLLEGVPF